MAIFLFCFLCLAAGGLSAQAAMLPYPDMSQSQHKNYGNDAETKFGRGPSTGQPSFQYIPELSLTRDLRKATQREWLPFDRPEKHEFSRFDFLPSMASFPHHGDDRRRVIFFYPRHAVFTRPDPAPVPLPAALPLFGLGLAGLMLLHRGRSKA